jgi:hypothetical protein
MLNYIKNDFMFILYLNKLNKGKKSIIKNKLLWLHYAICIDDLHIMCYYFHSDNLYYYIFIWFCYNITF